MWRPARAAGFAFRRRWRGACVDAWGRPGTASDGIWGVRGLLGAEGGVRAAGGAQGLRPRSLHGDPSPPHFFLGDSGHGGLFVCGDEWALGRCGPGFSLPCRISGLQERDHYCCLSPPPGTHLRHLPTHTHTSFLLITGFRRPQATPTGSLLWPVSREGGDAGFRNVPPRTCTGSRKP